MSNDEGPYREFEEALAAVLTEKEYDLDRRHRLAKARRSVNPDDPRYRQALERAFERWKI